MYLGGSKRNPLWLAIRDGQTIASYRAPQALAATARFWLHFGIDPTIMVKLAGY